MMGRRWELRTLALGPLLLLLSCAGGLEDNISIASL